MAKRRRFQLPSPAQRIVEALKDSIDCRLIVVSDEHDKSQSSWTFGDWFFRGTEAGSSLDEQVPKPVCHLEEAINDRWTLAVWTYIDGRPNPGVYTLVKWAAKQLAPHLPRRPIRIDSVRAPYPPAGSGGGPSGSGELGIPLWWARRTRS